MDIDEILNRINEMYGFKKKSELAKWFNIPDSTLHDRIKKAKDDSNKKRNVANKLYEDILLRIAEDDRINPNYIFFGKPPKFFDDKFVRRIRGEELPSYLMDDDVVTIPYYADIKTSVGNGYCNTEECESEFIVIPKTLCSANIKNIHAIKMECDSMSPNIKENSIIFVDTGETLLMQNSVYVLNYKGNIFVKRIQQVDGQILLKSDNMHYNTILCSAKDIKIIGRVVNSISSQTPL